MKRIIGLFISSLLFLFFFDSNAWASCTNASSGLGGYFCPITGDTLCGPPATGLRQCCTDPTECPALAPSPTPIGGAAGPTIEPYNPECDGGAGVKTALGCVPTDAEEFAKIAIPWSIYLGAGIAFLLGLYGAFLIITSSGDPEKVQAGKELITSVVIGVVVIIFAVTILTSIGVDVLGIFGF